jgi:hypothetical protein
MEKLLGSMMSSNTPEKAPEKSEDKVVDAEYKEKGEGE